MYSDIKDENRLRWEDVNENSSRKYSDYVDNKLNITYNCKTDITADDAESTQRKFKNVVIEAEKKQSEKKKIPGKKPWITATILRYMEIDKRRRDVRRKIEIKIHINN